MATTRGTGTGAAASRKLAEKPTLVNQQHQEKLKTHGRTLLEFEIGPATATTDLDQLDSYVRGIKTAGIDEWTLSTKDDVGFGIKRLRIGCIIKDDEVDWEDIKELIVSNTNLVQSADLYGLHKAKKVNE